MTRDLIRDGIKIMGLEDAMNVKCPKCGEKMDMQRALHYSLYEGWNGTSYEVQHEVSYLCYNVDCMPSEGEVE